MKLKSKLIATIVSICAAIAVMGVGVWAATTNFTVTVTNSVSLSFANLEGSVKVSAKANTDNTGSTAELTETTLFDNGTTSYTAISTAETATGTNLQFSGADFLKSGDVGNVDKDTTNAAVLYTFTYTALDSSSSLTSVTVTEVSAPTLSESDILTVSYYAKAEGHTGWTKLTSGSAFVVAAGKDVTVLAVAQYTNTNHKSISTTAGNWEFFVVFASLASGTATETGEVSLTGDVNSGVFA